MAKAKWINRGEPVRLNDEALRIEMARRNWPWYQLAARADLAPTNLAAYRHGHKPITATVVARLEKALGLTPGSLLLNEAQSSAAPASER